MVIDSETQDAALAASANHRTDRGWEVLADFAALLRIPNVTGHTEDLRANAEELVRRFQERGATMEIVEYPGAGPVVIGELRTSKPTATLGVYVHYDGQPVDPTEWTTPPFAAVLASDTWQAGGETLELPEPSATIGPEWRIYSRGASDDKAPFVALTAAIDALTEAPIDRTVDLVFLFDGEEESGSPNLGRYMTDLLPRLGADAWLLCDGPVHQTRAAQVGFGARGHSSFNLTFYGPERELHSGHYGNWVPNPVLDLATFLAGCKDDRGMVTIEGFYEDTLPLSEADQAAIEGLPQIEDQLMEDLGFGGPEVETGRYEHRLMIPSFNIRGIQSGAVGSESRNVIPAEATVSVDIRLASGDDPQRMLDRVEAKLSGDGYHVIDRDPTSEERRIHRRLAKLKKTPGYRAARVPVDSPFATLLLQACEVASGAPVVALPTLGGSVPLFQFEDLLGAPAAILPIANHDNNQHSADENLRIGNLWYGVDLWATLLSTDFSGIRSNARA